MGNLSGAAERSLHNNNGSSQLKDSPTKGMENINKSGKSIGNNS